MTYQGTVKNGVVVLETESPPPEGTRVRVEAEASPGVEDDSLGKMLLKYAGCIDGLPADFAAEHDHYIHGTPRRSEP